MSLEALHTLERITVLGTAAAASITLLAPQSRARLVAVWVLLGTAGAAAVFAGPRSEMYPAYAAVLLLSATAWVASRRVVAAPVRSVWRKGAGPGDEHVTEPPSNWRWLGRLLLFLVAMTLLAYPLGLLQPFLSATGVR